MRQTGLQKNKAIIKWKHRVEYNTADAIGKARFHGKSCVLMCIKCWFFALPATADCVSALTMLVASVGRMFCDSLLKGYTRVYACSPLTPSVTNLQRTKMWHWLLIYLLLIICMTCSWTSQGLFRPYCVWYRSYVLVRVVTIVCHFQRRSHPSYVWNDWRMLFKSTASLSALSYTYYLAKLPYVHLPSPLQHAPLLSISCRSEVGMRAWSELGK